MTSVSLSKMIVLPLSSLLPDSSWCTHFCKEVKERCCKANLEKYFIWNAQLVFLFDNPYHEMLISQFLPIFYMKCSLVIFTNILYEMLNFFDNPCYEMLISIFLLLVVSNARCWRGVHPQGEKFYKWHQIYSSIRRRIALI